LFQSGTPPIDAALLAPLETGVQLLRITPSEFQSRCLMTRGVKKEQAVAFYSKFWQLHVDSERAQRQGPKSKSSASSSSSNSKGGSGADEYAFEGSSSRELDGNVLQLPFQERIRPGMVVSWKPPTGFPIAGTGAQMGLVLCPASAAGSSAKDFQGKPVTGDSGDGKGDRYLCAMVLPGIMTGAYEISPWRQVVIDTSSMTGEVILEYDSVTRYYYMSV
jgi:kinesin family member 2/24